MKTTAISPRRPPRAPARPRGRGAQGRIRSLLAVTDFSRGADRATRRAARLAGELGARLELLHVVSASALADIRRLASGAGSTEERVLEAANRLMGAIAARLRPDAARVEVGALPDAILEAALDHDMLVLGARGESSLRRAVLGTTADRLLLSAARSMLVVKLRPDAAYRRVIVPCEYAPPARRALELATRVAPGARITLVHAFQADFEGALWRASVPREQIARLRADSRMRALAWLSKLRDGLDNAAAVDLAAEFGTPRRAILDLVESHGADLVVMGKQGRSKAGAMFLGSVTRQVLADARCDVLVAPLG